MQPIRQWNDLFTELLELRDARSLNPTGYIMVELRVHEAYGRWLEWSDGMTIEDAARSDAERTWLIEPPFMWHEDLPLMLGHVMHQSRDTAILLLAG